MVFIIQGKDKSPLPETVSSVLIRSRVNASIPAAKIPKPTSTSAFTVPFKFNVLVTEILEYVPEP